MLVLQLCCLVLAAFLPLARAQEASPPIQTTAELVVVDVQVVEKASGHSINNLNREDFEIFDSGKRQEIQQFDYGVSPLDVVLALDISGSMVQSARRVADGAMTALDALKRDDSMSVLAFSSRARVMQSWTDDTTALATAIREAVDRITRVESDTHLFDAVSSAISLFSNSRDPLRRRAILVISDDQDESSKISTSGLRRSVLDSNAILDLIFTYPLEQSGNQGIWRIGLPIPGLPPITRDRRSHQWKPHRSLRDLVQDSGGEYLYPETNREALAGIFDRLRARYTVAYRPSEDARDPGSHTIAVHLASGSKQNYTIRSRAGYWR